MRLVGACLVRRRGTSGFSMPAGRVVTLLRSSTTTCGRRRPFSTTATTAATRRPIPAFASLVTSKAREQRARAARAGQILDDYFHRFGTTSASSLVPARRSAADGDAKLNHALATCERALRQLAVALKIPGDNDWRKKQVPRLDEFLLRVSVLLENVCGHAGDSTSTAATSAVGLGSKKTTANAVDTSPEDGSKGKKRKEQAAKLAATVSARQLPVPAATASLLWSLIPVLRAFGHLGRATEAEVGTGTVNAKNAAVPLWRSNFVFAIGRLEDPRERLRLLATMMEADAETDSRDEGEGSAEALKWDKEAEQQLQVVLRGIDRELTAKDWAGGGSTSSPRRSGSTALQLPADLRHFAHPLLQKHLRCFRTSVFLDGLEQKLFGSGVAPIDLLVVFQLYRNVPEASRLLETIFSALDGAEDLSEILGAEPASLRTVLEVTAFHAQFWSSSRVAEFLADGILKQLVVRLQQTTTSEKEAKSIITLTSDFHWKLLQDQQLAYSPIPAAAGTFADAFSLEVLPELSRVFCSRRGAGEDGATICQNLPNELFLRTLALFGEADSSLPPELAGVCMRELQRRDFTGTSGSKGSSAKALEPVLSALTQRALPRLLDQVGGEDYGRGRSAPRSFIEHFFVKSKAAEKATTRPLARIENLRALATFGWLSLRELRHGLSHISVGGLLQHPQAAGELLTAICFAGVLGNNSTDNSAGDSSSSPSTRLEAVKEDLQKSLRQLHADFRRRLGQNASSVAAEATADFDLAKTLLHSVQGCSHEPDTGRAVPVLRHLGFFDAAEAEERARTTETFSHSKLAQLSSKSFSPPHEMHRPNLFTGLSCSPPSSTEDGLCGEARTDLVEEVQDRLASILFGASGRVQVERLQEGRQQEPESAGTADTVVLYRVPDQGAVGEEIPTPGAIVIDVVSEDDSAKWLQLKHEIWRMSNPAEQLHVVAFRTDEVLRARVAGGERGLVDFLLEEMKQRVGSAVLREYGLAEVVESEFESQRQNIDQQADPEEAQSVEPPAPAARWAVGQDAVSVPPPAQVEPQEMPTPYEDVKERLLAYVESSDDVSDELLTRIEAALTAPDEEKRMREIDFSLRGVEASPEEQRDSSTPLPSTAAATSPAADSARRESAACAQTEEGMDREHQRGPRIPEEAPTAAGEIVHQSTEKAPNLETKSDSSLSAKSTKPPQPEMKPRTVGEIRQQVLKKEDWELAPMRLLAKNSELKTKRNFVEKNKVAELFFVPQDSSVQDQLREKRERESFLDLEKLRTMKGEEADTGTSIGAGGKASSRTSTWVGAAELVDCDADEGEEQQSASGVHNSVSFPTPALRPIPDQDRGQRTADQMRSSNTTGDGVASSDPAASLRDGRKESTTRRPPTPTPTLMTAEEVIARALNAGRMRKSAQADTELPLTRVGRTASLESAQGTSTASSHLHVEHPADDALDVEHGKMLGFAGASASPGGSDIGVRAAVTEAKDDQDLHEEVKQETGAAEASKVSTSKFAELAKRIMQNVAVKN